MPLTSTASLALSLMHFDPLDAERRPNEKMDVRAGKYTPHAKRQYRREHLHDTVGVVRAWKQASRRHACRPARHTMDKTRSYLIITLRTPHGYRAVAPAFPKLVIDATSARRAYDQIKQAIHQEVALRIRRGASIPRNPVVQTKTLRVDLWYLKSKEDLL